MTVLTQQPGREDQNRRQLGICALLGSLCLFLSAIEYLIPKPLPFMRIGLANLPLLLALDICGPFHFFLLALIKVLGQGIIGGTLFSYVFLFSFTGTFASAFVMYALRFLFGKKRLGFTGLGCAGAMASNGVQLLLAKYFIFGSALRYLIPPFLVSGFITGIALGLICEIFCRRSKWYCLNTGNNEQVTVNNTVSYNDKLPAEETADEKCSFRLRRSRRWDSLFNADELFIAGLLMAVIFLLNRLPEYRAILFLFFCLLAWLSGKKNNIFATIIMMAGIIFFNMLVPYGKVLASFGPLRITQGSLLTGLEKAFTLTGLLMLSRACIKSNLQLPGIPGSVLGESFRLLELMREKKGLISRKNIIYGIDNLLLELESGISFVQNDRQNQKRNIKSILLLCAMVLATASVLFMPALIKR